MLKKNHFWDSATSNEYMLKLRHLSILQMGVYTINREKSFPRFCHLKKAHIECILQKQKTEVQIRETLNGKTSHRWNLDFKSINEQGRISEYKFIALWTRKHLANPNIYKHKHGKMLNAYKVRPSLFWGGGEGCWERGRSLSWWDGGFPNFAIKHNSNTSA